MDEALRIYDYLPMSYADKNEEGYIRFLWDAFETNYSPSDFLGAAAVLRSRRMKVSAETLLQWSDRVLTATRIQQVIEGNS